MMLSYSNKSGSNQKSKRCRCIHSPVVDLSLFLTLLMFCIFASIDSFVYQYPYTVSAMYVNLMTASNSESISIKLNGRKAHVSSYLSQYRSAPRSFLPMTATSSTDKPSSSRTLAENNISCDSKSNDESLSLDNENTYPVDDSEGIFETPEETIASEAEDRSNDNNEENNRERTKSNMARNLLYKNNFSRKSVSNTKKGRTHTSVGAIKGRSRSGKGKGTVSGNLLASVRKKAAVAASIAEKERKEKKKKVANDDETDPAQNEISDPLQLASATNKESLTNSNRKTLKANGENNEGDLKANLPNDIKNDAPKTTGIFQSTINRILHNQEETRQREQMFANHPDKEKTMEDAGTRPASKGIGLFGESTGPQLPEPMRKPFPGTILTYPSCHFLNPSSSSFKKWKKTQTSESSTSSEYREDQNCSSTPIQDAVTVRVATRLDDHQIANLRLSVFANYNSLQKSSATSPPTVEQMKQLHDRFRLRSCQVLESRRNLGAMCLIASVPKVFKNEFVAYSRNKQRGWRNLTSSKLSNQRMLEFWQSLKDWEREEEWIMGSVECSIHEFYGTALGKQRVKNGVLYITEVAVNPDARMIGVGNKLLQGVDKLAHIRNVETLYLHVDVTNEAAIRLYTKAGYKKVEPNPVHMSFTRSLNLHDGATNGRKHYLFYKHLRNPTILSQDVIWHDENPDEKSNPKQHLGFEMPK